MELDGEYGLHCLLQIRFDGAWDGKIALAGTFNEIPISYEPE